MSQLLNVEGHVLYALRNARVNEWPFPHFYVENVFPEDFYQSMLRELAAKTDYKEVEGRYHGRSFASPMCFSELEFMQGRDFLQQVCGIFAQGMKKRFESGQCVVRGDARLIRDCKGYYIGPHTDARWKVVSLLFYLPSDADHEKHGTSVYLPKARGLLCEGGPHHEFSHFDKIFTAPYRPNTCFGFFKTNNSFHGVEPIDEAFNRDVLLYNVYEERAYNSLHQQDARELIP